MDSDFRALATHLRAWDMRRRQAELLVWLPRAAALALGLALALALAARARPMLTRGELALAAAGLVFVALTAGAVVVFARQRSLAEQARFADRQFALRQRAVTAVEISSERLTVPHELAARQLRDTLDAASAIDTPRQMPLAARAQDWLPALGLLVALALALWLPNPRETLLLGQRAVAAAVGEQALALENLSADIAANDALTPEQVAALQQPIDEALASLNAPGVSQEEAVAALSQAEAELRSLSETFDHQALSEAGASAAAALGESGAAGELAEALQQGQAGQAAESAAELAEALPQLDAAAQRELADSLAAAAAEIAAADAALGDPLARAAEALAAGDTAAAQEALREAAGELAQQAQAGEAATQATAAADQLGSARQTMAAAGQAGAAAAQAVEDGTGQGQEANPQAGAGQGQGGEQPGAGGSAGEGPGSQGQGSATGGPGPGGGHVESVFVPAPVDLSGQGQDVELDVQCLGSPDACGPEGEPLPGDPDRPTVGSTVPYDQVYGDYRDTAFEALPGSGIPLGLQRLVREYFLALQP